MQKQKLWYWCACCQKMVCHPIGPHYLDNGTQMFCPECQGTTIVEFRMASWEKATREAIERAGDSILAERNDYCSCKLPGFSVAKPWMCPTCGKKHRTQETAPDAHLEGDYEDRTCLPDSEMP